MAAKRDHSSKVLKLICIMCVIFSSMVVSAADDFSEFESKESESPTAKPLKTEPALPPEPKSESSPPSATGAAPPPSAEAAKVAPATPAPSLPAEAPPKKRALRSTEKNIVVKNNDFPKALYFDSIGGGMKLPPAKFEYDLTLNQGKSLVVGNATLSDQTFYFALGPLGKMMPQYANFLGADKNRQILVMKWPESLFKEGLLEMISRNGKVIWKQQITSKESGEWRTRLSSWQKSINIDTKTRALPALLTTQMGIFNWTSVGAPSRGAREWFRFCLTSNANQQMTRLCSGRFMIKNNKGAWTLAKQIVSDATPRILVKNEEAQQKDSVEVAPEMPLAFYADLATGVSYEFVSLPPKLNFADISETKDPNFVRVIGWDVFPFASYQKINSEQVGKYTEMLGFQSTIKDTRQFWSAALSYDFPTFYFPGEGGGVFRQDFDLSNVPPLAARVYLHKDAPKGTYADSILLKGRKNPKAQVSSEEFSAQGDGKDPYQFEWDFKTGEKGEINRSYLQVKYDGKPYKSYFEVFRSHANELSGRFTGVYTDGSLVVMGEVAFNHWFESIMGWNNYYLSRQRWGLNGKYFKSLNQLPINTAGDKGSLDALVLDLKYRLTPGLWTRDESVGLIYSYQSLNFEDLKTPMMGVGAFWARSMPAVFDTIFNYFPYMDYPKWVDMEFIYYTTPLKQGIALQSSYSLNFHGQVLWTKSFFGEAGFGMKRYAFSDSSINKKAALNTFYGTLGLGIKF